MTSQSDSQPKRRGKRAFAQHKWGPQPRPLRLAIPAAYSPQGCARFVEVDRHHWKAELKTILDANNWAHSAHAKNVSHKTMQDRKYFYYSMFETLWYKLPTKMRVMPRNFAHDHVKALVAYWVTRPLKPATIRLYISYVRTFCDWIGKRAMVHEPEYYVDDPALVKRVYAAKEDKSWKSHGVDAAAKIAEMWAICPYAGCQAEMGVVYALRPKEGLMTRPHRAERDGFLMVSCEEDDERYDKYLEVKRGTKGGRVRWVPIDTPEKREALEKAKRLVAHKNAHLSVPGRSLAWNRRHFYTVCEKVGLPHKQLGVPAYGARHQYAGDRYEQSAGEPPPVRGGKPIDREIDQAARLRVARELGHARESITGAYLGGVLKSKRQDSQAPQSSSHTSASPTEDTVEQNDDSRSKRQAR